MTTQIESLEKKIVSDMWGFYTRAEKYKDRLQTAITIGIAYPTCLQVLDFIHPNSGHSHLTDAMTYLPLLPYIVYLSARYYREKSLENYSREIIIRINSEKNCKRYRCIKPQ